MAKKHYNNNKGEVRLAKLTSSSYPGLAHPDIISQPWKETGGRGGGGGRGEGGGDLYPIFLHGCIINPGYGRPGYKPGCSCTIFPDFQYMTSSVVLVPICGVLISVLL